MPFEEPKEEPKQEPEKKEAAGEEKSFKETLPLTQERFDEVYGGLKRAERKLRDQDTLIQTQHKINQKLASKVETLLQQTDAVNVQAQIKQLREAKVEARKADNFDMEQEIDDKILELRLKKSEPEKILDEEIKGKTSWEEAEDEFLEDNPDFVSDKRKARLSQVIYKEISEEDVFKGASPRKIFAELKRRTEEEYGTQIPTSPVGGVQRKEGNEKPADVLPNGIREETVKSMAARLGIDAVEFRKQIILSGGI